MIRLFQLVIVALFLSLVALAAATVTMRLVIHGAEVKIPSFRGMEAQEALNKAAELGLEMTVDNRFYSAEVPAGRILHQSPAAGTVVRRDWHVRVIESLGPQRVAIPNLAGQSERAATMQLRRVGLDLGTVAELPSSSAPPGIVVAQDPPPGAAGVERPSMSVLISGQEPVVDATWVMPDFTGRAYVTAAATLSRAGMKAVSVLPFAATPNSSFPPGTIVNQAPDAGHGIDASTIIELTVTR